MQGIEIDDFKAIFFSDDEQRIRIVMVQDGSEFYVECSVAALSAFLPFFIQASNVRQGSENVVTTAAADADAVLDTTGEMMLNLVGTEGAEFWYSLSRALSEKLSAALDSALRDQSPSTSKH